MPSSYSLASPPPPLPLASDPCTPIRLIVYSNDFTDLSSSPEQHRGSNGCVRAPLQN